MIPLIIQLPPKPMSLLLAASPQAWTPPSLIQPTGTDSWLASTIDYITTHFWRAAAARLQATLRAKGPLATAKLAMIPACRTVLLQLKWISPRLPFPTFQGSQIYGNNLHRRVPVCFHFIMIRWTPSGHLWHLLVSDRIKVRRIPGTRNKNTPSSRWLRRVTIVPLFKL